MPTNYARMTTPDLISKRSAKRIEQAKFRLENWSMSDKNVNRLELYVNQAQTTAPKSTSKPAPAPAVVAQAEQVSKATKATASLAFDKAHKEAPEGQRMKAGRRAYGLIMRGETDDHKLAAEAAIKSLV